MPDQRYVSTDLTHFVGASLRPDDAAQYDLLVKILRDGVLSANRGGVGTGFSTHPHAFSSGGRYEPGLTLVCFCDIPEADLSIHTSKYGRFGLSLSKTFLIRQGVNPVFYVVRESPYLTSGLRSDWFDANVIRMDRMREVLAGRHIREDPEGVTRWHGDAFDSDVNEFLGFVEQAVLLFVKWFESGRADEDPANVYMEREWRTVADVRFTLEDVTRVFVPAPFGKAFRDDLPDYHGQVSFFA